MRSKVLKDLTNHVVVRDIGDFWAFGHKYILLLGIHRENW